MFISLELMFPSVMCRLLLFFSYLHLKTKPNQIPKTKQQTHKQFKTSLIKPLIIQHSRPLPVLGFCLDFLNVTRNCKLVNCIPYFLRNYSDQLLHCYVTMHLKIQVIFSLENPWSVQTSHFKADCPLLYNCTFLIPVDVTYWFCVVTSIQM